MLLTVYLENYIFVLNVYDTVVLCVYRTVHTTGVLPHLWRISTIIHCTLHQVVPSFLPSTQCISSVVVVSCSCAGYWPDALVNQLYTGHIGIIGHCSRFQCWVKKC